MTATPLFHRNDWPTLGVEIELQLVDSESLSLKSCIIDLLRRLPPDLRGSVKPEFMQCYVEVNTGVCRSVAEVEADLVRKVRAVERAAALCGARLVWAGTHPFSRWLEQRISPVERYYNLADWLQESIVRPVTFGMHVHVGVNSGDKAIEVGDRLVRYLPLLLALSASSPFWQGRRTGMQSYRVQVLESLPTGGLPPPMHSWEEFQALAHQMTAAGFIESLHELWWDVRPSPGFGTVEVRVCDMPCDLPAILGLTALTQCLVQHLSEEIDAGVRQESCHPLLLRQNRWRASRYGMDAPLVDPTTLAAQPARRAADVVARRLRDTAERLGCAPFLEYVREMAASPTGAEKQLQLHEQYGSLVELVRILANQNQALAAPGTRVGRKRLSKDYHAFPSCVRMRQGIGWAGADP
jgi:carboxylate-amine ligase